MWAKQLDYCGKPIGKYHWFAEDRFRKDFFRASCNDSWGEWYLTVSWGYVCAKQPRHKDRCKRCVAALKRRE